MNFDDWITNDIKKVLLLEPNFPIPNKSRNHHNFLPIGLLKIASYLRSKSIEVKLLRYEESNDKNKYADNVQTTLDGKPVFSNESKLDENDSFRPDLICVTSIFTYWSKYVRNTVQYCRKKYGKDVPVLVGGIYASLLPDHCKEYTGCDDVILGQIDAAEKIPPAYDLVDVDYQIIHTTRGCIRKCGFCGTYIIEPEWVCKKTIREEILVNNKKKIIFYDNNLLANRFIEDILKELIELKKEKKITYVESQSGFDGRILTKKPYLAKMLKDAGFKNPKIAWDHSFKQYDSIKKQVDILLDGGFKAKELSIFMIYNYEEGGGLDYVEMEKKRVKCAEWGVQITDCRYRPLERTDDEYSPHKKHQTNADYHINPNWTDFEIRKFRRNIRRHNICMRHEVDYHSSLLERKKIPKDEASKYREMNYDEVKNYIPDAWSPLCFHDAKEKDFYNEFLINHKLLV